TQILLATFCLGQNLTKLEDLLSQELRNRSEVQWIVEKLRILRTNETYFGENHPNKNSARLQIGDLESDLNRIKEFYSEPPAASMIADVSMKIEDTLPQEIRNREDVRVIVQKLRFLRMKDLNLGQNHLSKKSTQLQISLQESALNSIIGLKNLPAPKYAVPENSQNWEDSSSQMLEVREDVEQSLAQKIIFLKISASSFGTDHPKRKSIQEQIRKYESSATANVELGQRSVKVDDLTVQTLQDRKDVRTIVQKLAFLRMYESNFGENHPNWKVIQTEIRDHEAALTEIIKLEHNVKRNSKEIGTR
ncbi:MAG TPA: hypothetical protein VM260_05535, partial [Pirellula sp.]|nr:hypothetical protein [Pirellula sp.]